MDESYKLWPKINKTGLKQDVAVLASGLIRARQMVLSVKFNQLLCDFHSD